MKYSHYISLCCGLLLFLFFSCEERPAPLQAEVAVEETARDTVPALTGTMGDTAVARVYLDNTRVLIDSARYEEALTLNQKAIEIYLNTVGKMDTLIAVAYNIESEIYWRMRELDFSLEAALRSLEITKKIIGENNLIAADSHENLGMVFLLKGVYDQSLSELKKSLSIRVEKLGEEHLSNSYIYNYIGVILDRKGDYNSALDSYNKALKIKIKALGEDHWELAAIYLNIGASYGYRGEYSKMLEFQQKALDIYMNKFGGKHPNLITIYNNMGVAWVYKGNYDKVLNCYEKGLQISAANSAEESANTARIYHNIGNISNVKGDYEKALVFQKKALEVYSNILGNEDPRVGTLLNSIGAVYKNKGEHDLALEYYKKALSVYQNAFGENGHPEIAAIYNNIGVVFDEEGNLESALEYHKRSLEITLQTFGGNHPETSNTYFNMGSLLADKGDYDVALDYYQKALEIRIHFFGKDHPDVARTYNNISGVWRNLGDFEKAMSFQTKSARILGYDPSNPHLFSRISNFSYLEEILYDLKFFFLKKYQLSQSPRYLDSLRTHYQTMLALEDYLQKEYTAADTRQFYAAQSIPVYEGAIANLLERNKPEELPETFLLAEKTKGRQLAEKIQSEPYTASFGLPDSLREREHELNVDIAYYEKKEFEEEYETQTPSDSLLSVYRDKIFDLRNQRDELLQTFKTDYPEYYNLRYGQQVVSIKGVQDSLLKEDDQALVEYFAGDSSLYAFTILPDTFYIHDIPLDFPLEQWVQEMRCGIFAGFTQDTTLCGNMAAAASRAQYVTAAHQLYQKIFAPIDALLPQNARVTIVPDGVLGYLPFDALLTKAPAAGQSAATYAYLLRNHTLSYAYSATLQKEMAYKQHRRMPQRNLLAMAPAFDAQTAEMADTTLLATRFIDITNQRNRLAPLQFNIPEAEAVGGLLGGDVVTGPAATEDAFRQRAADYRLLHLSTHGKANDQLGDYSFLAFHHLEDSLENEWLYNRELYNLELNADMVVLSACETGIGQLQRGEGIISLARGFSYAGAKSIVTSLWSVNDQSTKVLMESFYRNLKDGLPKDQALRHAKLDYLENNPNLGQEPFFWAAFIPIGDMAPVELSWSFGWLWWAAIIASVFIAGFLLYRRSGSGSA